MKSMSEYIAGREILNGTLPNWHKPAPRKPRVDRKKECREIAAKTRAATIAEAVSMLRHEMRSKPAKWHCAYESAITHLEIMASTQPAKR